MIKTFKNKALADLWSNGRSAKIDSRFTARLLRRLEALNHATTAADVNLPGYDFHPLKGHKPTRYTIHINGPWCVTFEFADGDAYHVDFEQYH